MTDHLHIHSACKLNIQGDNIQPCCTPFPILSLSIVPCRVLTVASWSTYRFLRKQVRWTHIPIALRIFHSCDPHSQRPYCSQWSRSRCYFEIFLNPACTSGSSRFMYCRSLAWRTLSIILLACEISTINSHFYINGWESKCVLTSLPAHQMVTLHGRSAFLSWVTFVFRI